MAILTRVSALFVIALAVTGTSAGTIQARTTASKNCSKNEFSFARGNKSCCLPTSAPSNPPAPPAEHECPKSGYYWHSGQKFCAPHTPPRDDDEPNCPSNCKWNHDEQYCEPTKPTKPATTSKPTPSPTKGNDQCGKNEWSFSGGNKKCCLPNTPPSNPPSPPSGHQCPPKGYYWHNGLNFCAPNSPPSGTPDCPKDCKWNKDDQYCQPNAPPTSTKPTPTPTPSNGDNCGKNEWYFNGGNKKCCLPHSPPSNPPSPPSGHQCPPKGYYWHSGLSFCAPTSPPTGTPDCPKDCKWNKDDQYCQPNTPPTSTKPTPTPTPSNGDNCGKNEWYFNGGNKKCCLPHSPPSNPPSPPSGHQCPPKGYYWHSDKKFCAPTSPPTGTPDCPKDCKWNKDDQYCQPNAPPTSTKPTPTPTGGDNCGKNEWHFNGGNKKCCLPHSPPSNPPSPPSGHQCPPKGYYWHSDKKFCAPHSPPSGPPECPKDCKWNKDDQYCQPNNPPHPQPTHGWGSHHNKRHLKSRAKSLCPTGLTACPVSSLAGADMECLDTKAELTSCGGCATLGQGQDCTAIEGAWNVGCEAGKCAVYTCQGGFTRSLDGKSCIAL